MRPAEDRDGPPVREVSGARSRAARLAIAIWIPVLAGCAANRAAPPPGAALTAPPAVAPSGPVTRTLFYATDRQTTGRAQLQRFYGSTWGDLHFGTARVSLRPPRRPGALSPVTRWFRTAGAPVRGARLFDLRPSDDSAFFDGLRDSLATARDPHVLVFIHGFNTPFERAARYFAQISRDLSYGGPSVLFAWPSSNRYLSDEETVECSEQNLELFLERLAREAGAARVRLLAHSMGSRALARALADLAERRTAGDTTRFDQVIFVAPDVDARLFTLLAPRLGEMARHVTLYASSRDKALKMSRAVHAHARAGGSLRHAAPLPGIDVIDVSKLRAEYAGHGYLDELVGDLRRRFAADSETARAGNP